METRPRTPRTTCRREVKSDQTAQALFALRLKDRRDGRLIALPTSLVSRRNGAWCSKTRTDFNSLRGDPSDKLPGATGVGPKRAAQLVRRYGSPNAVLETGLLGAEAKMLRLYGLIATMNASAPLPLLLDQTAYLGVCIEPRAQLGADSLGRSFGGEGMRLWSGMPQLGGHRAFPGSPYKRTSQIWLEIGPI
jgi:hypothetical protein